MIEHDHGPGGYCLVARRVGAGVSYLVPSGGGGVYVVGGRNVVREVAIHPVDACGTRVGVGIPDVYPDRGVADQGDARGIRVDHGHGPGGYRLVALRVGAGVGDGVVAVRVDVDVRCGPDGAGQVAVDIVGAGGARVGVGVPDGHLCWVGAGDNDGRGADRGRDRGGAGHGHGPGRYRLVALRVGAGVGDGIVARQGRVDRRDSAYLAGKVPVHPVDAGGPGVLVGRAGL